MKELNLAQLIYDHRRAAGWTQLQLATRAGITRGYVAKLESGVIATPYFASIRKLAAALGPAFWAELAPAYLKG